MCTTASTPPSYPLLSWKEPAAWVTSFLNNIITALSATLPRASPTLIGLSPVFYPVELVCKWQMTPKMMLTHILLHITFWLFEQMFYVNLLLLFQKQEKLKFCAKFCARPDGPDWASVNIEAFITIASAMPPYATGWRGLVGHYIDISEECSLVSGYFCTSNSSVFY